MTDLDEPGPLGMGFRTCWCTGHLTNTLEVTERGTLTQQCESLRPRVSLGRVAKWADWRLGSQLVERPTDLRRSVEIQGRSGPAARSPDLPRVRRGRRKELLTGPTDIRQRRSIEIRKSTLGAAAIGAMVVTAALLRQFYTTWGATPAEVSAPMVGDELVPFPKMVSTRATTISASPGDVWQWLVQIGQGRGGFYSYDQLPNLIGCDIHSADRIVPDYQQLEVGDQIHLAPRRAPSYRVAEIDPLHTLVLVGADWDSGEPAPVPSSRNDPGFTWQWSLRPLGDGMRTRLVVRQRYSFPFRQSVMWHVVEPIDFVMERRMLAGLAMRAEAMAAASRHDMESTA